jgi:hypothetical protein
MGLSIGRREDLCGRFRYWTETYAGPEISQRLPARIGSSEGRRTTGPRSQNRESRVERTAFVLPGIEHRLLAGAICRCQRHPRRSFFRFG